MIHTVYKPEENLDYLDDWFNHHTRIGVTHFYMYDNGGGSGGWCQLNKLNEKIDPAYNKAGFADKYSLGEARERQVDIFKKYNVTHIIWDNKDESGNIKCDQNRSFADFSNQVKSGLCAFIDLDEYIIKKEDFRVSRLQGYNYKSMFYFKSAHDCHERCVYVSPNARASKCILDMADFPDLPYSTVERPFVHFEEINLPKSESHFNHYNWSKFRQRKFNRDIDIPYDAIYEFDPDPGLLK